MGAFREEIDVLGVKKVPADAYYGVQSMRAAENFKITGRKVHPVMIDSIIQIKKATAICNRDVGALDEKIANAIIQACDEALEGRRFNDSFIVDSIQGGAGTSLNMNANEVLANRAIEILGGIKGDYGIVHPNDHVNCGQSTNDTYPSAGKLALVKLLARAKDALIKLKAAYEAKAEEYKDVIKMGRTEMQDAVPMSFKQVFGAYASATARDIARFELAMTEMMQLNMGATAIGTGINAHPEYIKKIVPTLSEVTHLPLTQTPDLVDGTQNLDSFVYVSGIIKACATTLSKIANDLRLMSSGPRCGFGEITLSPKQNGSSIMPGKVNPVIPEVMSQISFNIIGNDTTVTHAAEAGQLELNAFEPIIFHCLFESLETLTNGVNIFRTECIEEITVNAERCKEHIENSIGIVTALCPHIGYTKSSNLAKKALREGKYIRDVVLEEENFTPEELDEILDAKNMI